MEILDVIINVLEIQGCSQGRLVGLCLGGGSLEGLKAQLLIYKNVNYN